MSGILYPDAPPMGALAPATVNPLLYRQVQAQRQANPRPDVTDLFGYGPSWSSYGQNLVKNIQESFPINSPEAVRETAKRIAMNAGPLATVYHGSPHLFDKFDMSKIGTGEGAQAYGHGLYLAESPSTAAYYRSALSNDQPSTRIMVDGKPLLERLGGNNLFASDVGSVLERSGLNVDKAISNSSSESVRRALEGLRGSSVTVQRPGNLYKVDLPDEAIGKMLDWDKPLSQQPESVRKALESNPATKKILDSYAEAYESAKRRALAQGLPWPNKAVERMSGGEVAGSNLYKQLTSALGEEKASAALRAAGITGIKYLDQGSRGSGAGTRNFVVFDDSLPRILGRE